MKRDGPMELIDLVTFSAVARAGGITRAAAPDYLALPNVISIGGSWVAPRAMIDAKDWQGIEALARDAAALKRV